MYRHTILLENVPIARNGPDTRLVTSNVKMTCMENYENWLNCVKVMPEVLSVVSYVILTNFYFRILKVVQQRN